MPVARSIIESIEITIRYGNVPAEKEFLPGVCIDHTGLLIDFSKLKHPGDLLHEAGHLAVATPAKRKQMDGVPGNDSQEEQAEEMMAIAWSYAAANHLKIDPHIVFHSEGYQGGGKSTIKNFRDGHFFGVSTLQWIGLTYEPKTAREKNMLVKYAIGLPGDAMIKQILFVKWFNITEMNNRFRLFPSGLQMQDWSGFYNTPTCLRFLQLSPFKLLKICISRPLKNESTLQNGMLTSRRYGNSKWKS